MLSKLFFTFALPFAAVNLAKADELDAIVNDATRAFTKRANSPEKFSYGRITVDSKGKLVSTVIKEGKITSDTVVAMSSFDEKKKVWTPGEAIKEGVAADLFKDKGKVLRMRLRLADDNATIKQILVTSTDEKLEQADKEFDAIFKGHSNNNFGGRIGVSYVRVELDEKGQVTNKFALTATSVNKDTKIAMGKYNEKEKVWKAGEDIPNGVFGDLFKDPGAKTIYVRITNRDDNQGIAQILVRQIGDPVKK